VAANPNDAQAHYDMAVLYAQEKETQRAIAELHRALDLNPNHKPARELLARHSK
jgi:Tfp pilus assembly protein PilF